MSWFRFLPSALSLVASCQYIEFHQITFYTFRDMLWTSFLFTKIRKGSISVNIGDRFIVLKLCNSPHDPLSVYQVSFSSIIDFQRYALDKLCSAKIKKRSGSVNTGDRLWSLYWAILLMTFYEFYSFPLYPFRDKLWTSFVVQKLKKEVTP